MVEHQPSQPTVKGLPQRFVQTALTKRNLLVLGSFVFGCALTGYFFSQREARPPEHVPTIRAEITPYKIRPENDEQPRIPHEDKLVYNRLAPTAGAEKVERLLPKPEKPIIIDHKQETTPEEETFDTEEMFPLETNRSVPAQAMFATKQPRRQESFPLLQEKPKIKPALTQPAAVKPLQKKREVVPTAVTPGHRPVQSVRPVAKKVVIKQVVTPQKPVRRTHTSRTSPSQKIIPAQKARYRVQLAAMRTPTLARQEWHRLVGVNPQLKPLKTHIVRIDLGAKKGIFYRVQSGRFSTQEQAQRLCRQLKQKTPKLPCLVVPIDRHS